MNFMMPLKKCKLTRINSIASFNMHVLSIFNLCFWDPKTFTKLNLIGECFENLNNLSLTNFIETKDFRKGATKSNHFFSEVPRKSKKISTIIKVNGFFRPLNFTYGRDETWHHRPWYGIRKHFQVLGLRKHLWPNQQYR